jgi:TOMM system kinase/cyclase fusion protein
MDFDALLAQVRELLQRQGRVSYRALKLRFQLDDETLAALKDELIYAERVARDEEDRVLVWGGKAGTTAEPARQSSLLLPPETAPAAPHTSEAERRQLTVMFCDLVDSTPLSEALDPEDLREVVRAYQATCAAVIQRYDGYIAQYLGDGLLVYFGYPQAHEDDAHRAVRTGLGIVKTMGTLNAALAQKYSVRLAVRVGIHTGLAVVGGMGDSGRQEQLALGETPNIAARLQGLAAPDTVVISEATSQLIRGYFVCQTLGTQDLKGIFQSLMVYQVLRETEAQTRLDVAATRGLTPLVGRNSEVTVLWERWAQVKDGMGQVILLSGEAGIGKSRLAQVLKEHVAGEPHTRWECRCSLYYQNTALYPLIDLFPRALDWHPDDVPDEKLSKLEHALRQYALPLDETVPLLATLLSLPLPIDRYPLLSLSPQRQRQKTLEALLALLLERAAHQPLLFIVEDLQWSDPSTLELLTLLLDQVPTTRLLTLLTCRPEFPVPWTHRVSLTQLTLGRLGRPQVEAMITRVLHGKALPPEVVEQIVAKTDGVPLFVEELTKMVLESGLLQEREERHELTGPLPPLAIPATLHDSLMARLDRLTTVKATVQLGATIGRQFSYELLQAVALLDEAALQHSLRQLVEAEIVYQRGVGSQTLYTFKHALIQDAAYQSLLKSTRQQYHQRIAQVLEARFAQTAETQPELLAHHYTEAGLSEQAMEYWQQAAQRALQRWAHLEAIGHLSRGLEVLKILPSTPKRARQELLLQTILGSTLMATKGHASPEVEQAYARARELCQHVEDTPQLFPVVHGLCLFYRNRGELRTSYEIAKQLLTLAQSVQDSAYLLVAHQALGTTLFYAGELAQAREHLAQGKALYDPQQHRAHAILYGQDPGVVCLSFATRTLWLLGYPDQALQLSQEALTLARELSHPFSLAFALFFAAWTHQYRGEQQLALERTEALLALSTEQGFVQRLAQGRILQAAVLVEQGRGAEGIAQIRQSLATYGATGADLGRPAYLALLAEAYGRARQADEGLTVLAEALTAVQETGIRFHEAELYRLEGELLLRQAIPAEQQVETCFHQALAVARRQQAKSLELRAAMSLARLWQQQGQRAEAYELLAPIYGWFTEGFDTADLQEAKALLKELS